MRGEYECVCVCVCVCALPLTLILHILPLTPHRVAGTSGDHWSIRDTFPGREVDGTGVWTGMTTQLSQEDGGSGTWGAGLPDTHMLHIHSVHVKLQYYCILEAYLS